MSCMSMKAPTCCAASACAHARRSSLSVSGPKVEKSATPAGFSTRRNSANTLSRSLHHCSVAFEKMRSTDCEASGRCSASPQINARRLRSRVAPRKRLAEVTGAGADIHRDGGPQTDVIETLQQACADLALQHRDPIVVGRGAIETRAHAAFVETVLIDVMHVRGPKIP